MDPSYRREKMRGGVRRKKRREREERGEGGGAGENGAEVSGEAAGVASFQLMYLAHEGNADGIRKPLDAGADPNFRDSDACTMLHISTCEGHTEVVDLLLDRGAETVVEDQRGSTMNVLLHMELTERMKIMPSHIMLRILSCRREYLLMTDLPPRDEQLISDLKQLCMHARCSSGDRRHQRWSRRQVTAGAPDTKMPRISDFLTEDSTWTRGAIAATT